MNSQLADMILNFVIQVAQNPAYAFPFVMWLVAVWRVALLRPETHSNPDGVNLVNFQEKVRESVAETAHEHISSQLQPLFDQCNIQLPQGINAYGILVDRMLTASTIHDLQHLSEMSQSLAAQGVNSPFFTDAVAIIQALF